MQCKPPISFTHYSSLTPSVRRFAPLAPAEDLHNSTLLSHLSSAVFSSSSSSSSIPLLMSLFPPLGLEVELDRLYSVTRDEARPINSRGNLSFVFHWFCDLFVSSKAQSRGKGKSKAKVRIVLWRCGGEITHCATLMQPFP